MKVIMVEPGRNAQIVEIEKGLKSMQKAVGGYIQAIYPFDDEVALVCNEEGKMIGLPLNRNIYYSNGKVADIICGSFFICSAPEDSEEFESLSEEQIATYYKLFEKPDYEYEENNVLEESEKSKMKKFVVNCDYAENSELAISTAKDIVEYLNNGEYTDLDTAIADELDRILIYYDDQWELIKTYQTPQEANYDTALEMFMSELYSIIKEEIEQEIEEEQEEER